MFAEDALWPEQIHRAVEESLEGQTGQVQGRLRRGYSWLGIRVDKEKVLSQCNEVGKLDACINNKNGVPRLSTQKALDMIGLGCYLRGLRSLPKKALQVWAGQAVHVVNRGCVSEHPGR